jgi:serine/threonine protein kinase
MSDQTYNILVVDDNDLNRDMLSRRLERRGFHVERARDGYEALSLVERGPVDLVLLDIMMPGISGMDVLRKLRESHPPTDLPVIMATAKDQSEDMVQAFELGANDYVTKPLDFQVVLARVQAHLRTMAAARRARAVTSFVPPPPPGGEQVGVGSVLAEKYRLESRIGSGNFGDVYRALHIGLQRPVAVKLLQAKVAAGSADLDRFRQEGISSCRLDHPNAVQVMDFGVTPGGVAFLVMELLEGQSLLELLEQAGSLSSERCAEILDPICDVLTESHELGLIHRDIKPGNIFLHHGRGGEVVKVVDFGIAKLAGDAAVSQNLTIDGGIIGTPAYMAPERLTGRQYDGRSDVYSLGVMLFEMLAGAPPFAGTTDPMSLAFMHVQKPPPPLRSVRPDLPRSVEAVVMQTLEKDYRLRPSAELLARKFRRALRDVETEEPAGPTPSRLADAPPTLILPPE